MCGSKLIYSITGNGTEGHSSIRTDEILHIFFGSPIEGLSIPTKERILRKNYNYGISLDFWRTHVFALVECDGATVSAPPDLCRIGLIDGKIQQLRVGRIRTLRARELQSNHDKFTVIYERRK